MATGTCSGLETSDDAHTCACTGARAPWPPPQERACRARAPGRRGCGASRAFRQVSGGPLAAAPSSSPELPSPRPLLLDQREAPRAGKAQASPRLAAQHLAVAGSVGLAIIRAPSGGQVVILGVGSVFRLRQPGALCGLRAPDPHPQDPWGSLYGREVLWAPVPASSPQPQTTYLPPQARIAPKARKRAKRAAPRRTQDGCWFRERKQAFQAPLSPCQP